MVEDQVVDALLVRGAMAQLSPKQRQAVAMRYYAGAAEHEIAAALAISPGTVKTHLARGTRRLRDLLSAAREDEGTAGPTRA